MLLKCESDLRALATLAQYATTLASGCPAPNALVLAIVKCIVQTRYADLALLAH
jgi:hypothetical protein